MNPFFPNRESGTSLIELIMAAGIMAVIGYFAAQFFQRVSRSEYEARAKTMAISETALYMNSLERDFKLRDMSAASTLEPLCPSKCQQFSIDRKVRVGTSDTDMKVNYSTKCATIPASMKGKFKDGITGKDFDFKKPYVAGAEEGGQGLCFAFAVAAAGCGPGSYPQFVVTLAGTPGATLPTYPRLKGMVARFPDLSDKTSAASGVIGAVTCAESKMGAGSIGSDRITIETAYINAEGKYRIEKRDITIPRSNVAKIQMLPGQ